MNNPVIPGRTVIKPDYDLLYNALFRSVTLDNENYTVTDTDGYSTFILSGTLTANRTVTQPTLAANQQRVLRYIDISTHGAFKWIIDGEGAETINGFTTIESMYDGEWSYTIYGQAEEWKVIGGDVGTLKLIPEASRPAAYVLNAGTATSFTDVDFGPYRPVGTKALRLKFALLWTGDGVQDYAQVNLRQNGSAETDTERLILVGEQYSNLGSGVLRSMYGEIGCLLCDASGIIEYSWLAGATPTTRGFYLNIEGYYL